MKLKYPTLDNIVPALVAFVAASIVGMTFTNYVICNFKVMTSLHYLYLVKAFNQSGAKPPSKCDDNTSESIQTLMSLLATIIALKADLRKKPEENEKIGSADSN
jgi:hypothetical protein